jgi:hypothetical protein
MSALLRFDTTQAYVKRSRAGALSECVGQGFDFGNDKPCFPIDRVAGDALIDIIAQRRVLMIIRILLAGFVDL